MAMSDSMILASKLELLIEGKKSTAMQECTEANRTRVKAQTQRRKSREIKKASRKVKRGIIKSLVSSLMKFEEDKVN